MKHYIAIEGLCALQLVRVEPTVDQHKVSINGVKQTQILVANILYLVEVVENTTRLRSSSIIVIVANASTLL